MDVQRPQFTFGLRSDDAGIKQCQRRCQLVAATAYLVDRQIQFGFQMLQLLPDGAAAHSESFPECLPGMKPAILEEIQQLQHASLDFE